MKKNNLFKKLSLLLVLPIAMMFALAACSDDDPASADDPDDIGPGLNVVETAAQTGQYSILVDLIMEAGLDDALDDGEFTLLAPSDLAFNELPDGTLESLTTDQIEQILMFHVIPGSVQSTDIAEQQDAESLLGELLMLERSGENVTINASASVNMPDLTASNGYVHEIDEVLLPSELRTELGMPNIIDIANNTDGFDILLSAIDETGLTTTFKYQGPFTVFPPNDDAFATFGVENVEALSAEQLTEVLSYHVLGINATSDSFELENAFTTLADEDIYVVGEEGEVTINSSANVVMADVEAENGVIHAIDNVLLPDAYGTVLDNLMKRFELSALTGLLEEQDMTDVLSEENAELTVFAPNNTAFEMASGDIDGLSDEELTQALLYHVIDMTVESSDLEESQMVETLNNDEAVLVEIVDGAVLINETAQVQLADISGTNGVIHIIDAVLIPKELGGGAPE